MEKRLKNVTEFIKIKMLPDSLYTLNFIFLLSLLSSAVISGISWLILRHGTQTYSDIIVGSITWFDFYKSLDYRTVTVILGSFIAAWVVLTPMVNKITTRKKKETYPVCIQSNLVLNIVVGFFCYSLTLLLAMPGTFPTREFLITSVLAVMGFLFYYKVYTVDSKVEQSEVHNNFIIVLLSVLFSHFSVLAVLVVANNRFPTLIVNQEGNLKTMVSWLVFLFTLVAFFLSYHNKISNRLWVKIIYGAQLVIPAVFIMLINGFYFHNGTMVGLNIPFSTKIVIALFTLGIMLYNLKIFIFNSDFEELSDLNRLILWPSVVSISFFLSYKSPVYSAFVRDDFHLGELILPWQQIVEFGQKAYTEYVSVQGLLGLFYGGINSIVFEGTASSFPLAHSFVAVIFVTITAFLLCRLVGTGWALVLSGALTPISDRLFMVLPIIFILANQKLINRSLMWLLCWGGLSLLHTFYNPSAGSALTVATLPIAVWILILAFANCKIQDAWQNYRIITIVVLVPVVGIVGYLAPSMVELLKFIHDNGSLNTTAYGISLFYQNFGLDEWYPRWFPWPKLNYFLWESFRIGGWISGTCILWYLFIRNLMKQNSNTQTKVLNSSVVISLTSIIFVVAMIPYSMGRIDPGALSRPGSISLLITGTLFPLVLIMSTDFRKKALITVAIIGVLLGIRSSFIYQNPEHWVIRAISKINVPQEAKFINGVDIGLPKLGKIFIVPEKLTEIQNLKNIVDTFLKKGETYFDLTNRSVMYFALNRRVPGVYSADYLAANYELQEKMLNAIKKDIPPLVWLGPSIRHDGGLASLRSYRVYRWLAQQGYRYYEDKGYQLMVRKDRYEELGLPKLSDTDNLEMLRRIFHQSDLYSVPIAWGRNMSMLESRFKKGTYSLKLDTQNSITVNGNGWAKISGPDPYMIWKTNPVLDGSQFDFVKIEIKTKEGNDRQFRGQIFWQESGEAFSEEKSFRFNVKEGTLLVPLGSHPQWLNGKNIERIRFDFDNYAGEARIDSILFMSLVK